jgi:hypothetical protein
MDYVSKSQNNECETMIYAIEGDCGSGKTLLMTILAYGDYLDGADVYANYGLHFKGKNKTKVLTDAFFRNYEKFPIYDAVLCMDELSMYYSSRRSFSKQNLQLKPFILQTRKRTLKLYYTAQQMRLVDVNIRENTDGFYYCEIWVSRQGSLFIRKTENWKHKEGDTYVLKYTYLNKKWQLKKSGSLHRAERFFNLYDTHEIITFHEEEKKKEKKM